MPHRTDSDFASGYWPWRWPAARPGPGNDAAAAGRLERRQRQRRLRHLRGPQSARRQPLPVAELQLRRRSRAEPADPSYPPFWQSRWTMYRVYDGYQTNPPPYNGRPPAGTAL